MRIWDLECGSLLPLLKAQASLRTPKNGCPGCLTRTIIVSFIQNDYDGIDMTRERIEAEKEDPPPFFRTWNGLYTAVVVYTCILILVLYVMTITLNR
jgi:hypothetical protein